MQPLPEFLEEQGVDLATFKKAMLLYLGEAEEKQPSEADPTGALQQIEDAKFAFKTITGHWWSEPE